MTDNGVVNGSSSKLCLRLHSLSNWAIIRNFSFIAKFTQMINRLLSGADIDCRARVSADVKIPHTVGIVIGETAIVEAGVTLMPHVTLGATSHASENRRHPWIKSDSYIGAGAVLVGPIVIGAGATVGANAVVTKDVNPGSTVVGIPAREHTKNVDV